jgi:hypothetical protein
MLKVSKAAPQILSCTCLLVLAGALMAGPASAAHSWNGYHWARIANPFILILGDNVSNEWKSYLQDASNDWSESVMFETDVQPGGAKPKNCRPTEGMVQVCSSKYGFTGWLGVAQIWATGSHITQGRVKLNDSYFASPIYDQPEWRRLVACQEVGHTFGLDHQDEDQTNTNLGTCMDYTSNPLGPPDNEHPNTHDYDELALIYQHLDDTTTVGVQVVARGPRGRRDDVGVQLIASTGPADDWGRAVRFTNSGKGRVFVKELAPNRRVITFVTWIEQ